MANQLGRHPNDAVEHVYARIGELTVTWARTEVLLNYWLHKLLDANEEYSNLFISTLSTSLKIERLRVLAMAHYSNGAQKIKGLIDELDDYREERNDLVHSAWMTITGDDSGDHVVKAIAGRQQKPTAVLREVPIKTSQVIALTDKIEAKTEEIKQFFKSVGLFS